MSLDRLIELSKRTGDRLIVHNPIDEQDVVIMSVDQYESLLDDKTGVKDMTSKQLLDSINRDISIWRSNRELDEAWERADELEDELWEREINNFDSDPFAGSWHQAGDILNRRYGNDEFEVGIEPDEDDGFFLDDLEPESEVEEEIEAPMYFEEIPEEPGRAPIGFPFDVETVASAEPQNTPLPYLPKDENWKDEPLSDEPVFYEEPV